VDDTSFEVVSEITDERFRVEFRWLQTAISLRHADAVDVRFSVNGQSKTLALPHAALERSCRNAGIPLTDPLCRAVAARRLEIALRTGMDAEKDLITLTPEQVEEQVGALVRASKV
jgi:hypothetical protein